MMFLQELFVHFLFGIGSGFALVLLFNYYKKRRPLLRFGGDSPLSLGEKQHWTGWYLAAYLFEMITSFHWGVGPRLYVELAYSIFQAGMVTAGWFLVDRLAMMAFEPEEHWKQKAPVKEVANTVQPASELPAPELMDLPRPNSPAPVKAGVPIPDPVMAKPQGSWLGRKLKDLASGVGSTVGNVHEGLAAQKADRVSKDEEERRARSEKLKKLLDGN